MNVTAEATVNIYVMRGSIKLTTVYGFPEFYEGEDVVIKVWVTVDLFAVFFVNINMLCKFRTYYNMFYPYSLLFCPK